ncbi:hypothetical protein JR316_0012110 [Psilocybe cubensis]|uniref:Uncharacterized protein n=2 Tax=Psilocybe cubensis TaxID=181762 RepID=A0ACB8GH73_PSICU|nr:hypothetical protein JR316_0012110 [Psilocybe cubensis]KAH9475011.1 hypothetical protein JR316_0012110 [Psilocybe cubensis]
MFGRTNIDPRYRIGTRKSGHLRRSGLRDYDKPYLRRLSTSIKPLLQIWLLLLRMFFIVSSNSVQHQPLMSTAPLCSRKRVHANAISVLLDCFPRPQELVERITISVVSRVSLSLRKFALPYLLRTVCLDESPKQIVGFLSFVIENQSELGADTLGPGGYVFELELHEAFAFNTHILNESGDWVVAEEEPYPIATWAPMLSRALKLMHNLRSFAVKGNTDEICAHAPNFGQAVSSLYKLTSLTLWGVWTETSRSFGRAVFSSTTFSFLRYLELVGEDEDDDEVDSIVHVDRGMGQFLSKINGASLTDLTLGTLDLIAYFENTPVVFPFIRSLTIDNCRTSLKSLSAAFPSIQTLNLGFSLFLHRYYHSDPPANISLSNLVSIGGRYKDILVILKCNAFRERVRRVIVSFTWDGHDDDDALPFALPRLAPQLKSIHFKQSKVQPLEWWTEFGQHFFHLGYLQITIYSSSDEDWDFICNNIPIAISSIPLAYLSITVQEYASITTNPAFSEESVALAFSNGITSLKYVEVFKQNLTDQSDNSLAEQRFWWEIVRRSNSAGFEMKRLSYVEGTRLRDYYDMQAAFASTEMSHISDDGTVNYMCDT